MTLYTQHEVGHSASNSRQRESFKRTERVSAVTLAELSLSERGARPAGRSIGQLAMATRLPSLRAEVYRWEVEWGGGLSWAVKKPHIRRRFSRAPTGGSTRSSGR